MDLTNLNIKMDLTNLKIGSLFKINNESIICKLIGYNYDRTKIFYIQEGDNIIQDNMKQCDVINITLLS